MGKAISKFLTAMLLVVFSWGCICGLVKLITLCFGWTFTWKIGTGVWLSSILLRVTFVGGKK